MDSYLEARELRLLKYQMTQNFIDATWHAGIQYEEFELGMLINWGLELVFSSL